MELKLSSGNEIVDRQMDRQSEYYRAPTSSDAGATHILRCGGPNKVHDYWDGAALEPNSHGLQ
jgi:hypothetical protein